MKSVYNRKRGIYYLKIIVYITHYMLCLNSKSHIVPADGDRKNQSYIKADNAPEPFPADKSSLWNLQSHKPYKD